MDKLYEMLPVVGIILIVFGSVSAYAIVNTIVINMRKSRIAEQNAVLKKEMIDKGFTADEILRVIAAGAEPVPSQNPVTHLTEIAIENGGDTEEIAELAKAMDAVPEASRSEIARLAVQMIEHDHSLDDIVEFVKSRTEAAKIAGKSPENVRVA